MKRVRFIPTQVGNTRDQVFLQLLFAVHPHTSGEYIVGKTVNNRLGGSSPHKWGIPHTQLVRLAFRRFIPTQVGNTKYASTADLISAVHPHTSGEYCCKLSSDRRQMGSSPHKWGILRCIDYIKLALRFIPTQVGNTSRPSSLRMPRSVHPHTSGEYLWMQDSSRSGHGSSPHKWGIP